MRSLRRPFMFGEICVMSTDYVIIGLLMSNEQNSRIKKYKNKPLPSSCISFHVLIQTQTHTMKEQGGYPRPNCSLCFDWWASEGKLISTVEEHISPHFSTKGNLFRLHWTIALFFSPPRQHGKFSEMTSDLGWLKSWKMDWSRLLAALLCMMANHVNSTGAHCK